MRILIVEDEVDLANALSRALDDADFAVDVSHDGEDALFRAREVAYDAILLDLMLPKRSGWSVLAALRSGGRTTPILIVTARDSVDDRIRGLNLGADDYITKPFAVAEVVARIGAVVRRAAAVADPSVSIGDVRVDLAARRVHRAGAEIELTAREYGILDLLLRRRGAFVTRTEISEGLYNDDSEFTSNAIDVHVAALRRKLGVDLIQTRRGQGYLVDG